MEAFLSGFSTVLQFQYLAYMFAGVSLGLLFGFLPGLTGAMAIALMLPFSFGMPPLTALVFMLSIYTGGLFGGAVTAILIKTPGAPSNIMTTLDGYPMHRKGQSERALGLALMSSVIGGIVGCLFLLVLCKPLAAIALKFSSAEMFMVMIFGLSVVGSLANNPFKAIFSGLCGVLLGTVGVSVSGVPRGTLNSMYLLDGVPLTPALIGLVALPKVFALAANPVIMAKQIDPQTQRTGSFQKLWGGCAETFRHLLQALVCSVTGVIVGIMPAAGASIAGLITYNQSKQWSKKREQYGTGIPEGIVSCETANNAAEGGALATMFVLGIPGSGTTAMLLGALIVQGWSPGPKLFIDHQDVIYTAISSLFCQQFVMLIVGGILCVLGAKLLKLPLNYLAPCILVMTVVGSFANRNALFDCTLLLGAGCVGWVMKKQDFPVMPLLLGLMLGSLADENLIRIYQLYDSFWEIFTKPIPVVLGLISLLCIALPPVTRLIRRKEPGTKNGRVGNHRGHR